MKNQTCADPNDFIKISKQNKRHLKMINFNVQGLNNANHLDEVTNIINGSTL